MHATAFLSCWLLASAPAFAQLPKPTTPSGTAMPPAAAVRTPDLDRTVLDTLREVHNKGAELYNAGDHAGALRLYQGGLIVAKSFLAHREKLRADVGEGLDQVEKSQADGKLKAFRLHEVIEQVRGELKEELKKATSGDKPAEAAAAGTVTVHGKPAAGVTVAFVPMNTTKALATTKTGDGGTFNVVTTLPVGTFLVTLSGDGVPASYTKPETTPLKSDLKAGVNSLLFEAK